MTAKSLLISLFIWFFCFEAIAVEVSKEGFFIVNNSYDTKSKAHSIQIKDLDRPDHFFTFPYTQQKAWTFSGLPNGDYSIEVVSNTDAAAIDRITVKHWSLTTAIPLFLIGLFMFLALVVILYRYQILEHKNQQC